VLQQIQRLRRELNSHEFALEQQTVGPRLFRQTGSLPRIGQFASVSPSKNQTHDLEPLQHRAPLLAVEPSETRPACRPAAVHRAHRLGPGGTCARHQKQPERASSQPGAGKPAVLPNPSLKLTRYGRRCKPGLSQSYYRLSPGLQRLPPRAA
jgi:hypothetical protein